MDKEMLYVILPVAASLITLIIQAIVTSLSDSKKQKNELMFRIYDDRLLAYKQLYKKLIEYKQYFNSFIQTDNEFLEVKEPNEFAPLSVTEDISSFFDSIEIYLADVSISQFHELIRLTYGLNNIAIHMPHGESKDEVEEAVLNSVSYSCEKVVMEIDKYLSHIKKTIGISRINSKIKY